MSITKGGLAVLIASVVCGLVIAFAARAEKHDTYDHETVLRPEQFGAIPDDGLDDYDAFKEMFDRCRFILGQHNNHNFTVGPKPAMVMRGGAIYHHSQTLTLPKCSFGSDHGLSGLNWIGPAGGVQLRMENRNGRPSGSGMGSFYRLHGIVFNQGSHNPDVGRVVVPNGYPRTNLLIDFEDGYTNSHLADLGFRLEDIAFRRTSGPAFDNNVGAINFDFDDKIRFDDVDTGYRHVIGPRNCMFRGQMSDWTIHGFRTAFQIDNHGGKCLYGLTFAHARIEALPKGEQQHTGPVQLIEYNYWGEHGSSANSVWFHLEDIKGQVSSGTDWAIMRVNEMTDHTGRNAGLRPTIILEGVGLNGPLLAGDIHPDYLADPLLTDPSQGHFFDWKISRAPGWGPWVLKHELIVK